MHHIAITTSTSLEAGNAASTKAQSFREDPAQGLSPPARAHQELVDVNEGEPLVAPPEGLVADVVHSQLRAVVDGQLQVDMIEPVHPAHVAASCYVGVNFKGVTSRAPLGWRIS